jgi:hypothetical protein
MNSSFRSSTWIVAGLDSSAEDGDCQHAGLGRSAVASSCRTAGGIGWTPLSLVTALGTVEALDAVSDTRKVPLAGRTQLSQTLPNKRRKMST